MTTHEEEGAEPTERSPLLGTAEDDGIVHAPESRPDALGPNVEDADEIPLANELDTTKLTAIMCAIWISAFFAALDATIIATLSGPISSSFDSMTLFSWLAAGYLISCSAFQPLSGKLTDIYSRRTGLVVSNVVFGLGTLICGLARREWVIILGRVVAGVGGGCIPAIATFVTSDLIPLRRRGLWQGYNNIVYGMGMGLGGVFGGWISDTLNWRWAFLVQVPFIALSTVLCWFLVKIPVKESNRPSLARIDFLGAVLMVTWVALLLLGLNTGGNQLPWSHPLVITSLVLAPVVFLAFLYVEACVALEPIIPVRLVARTRTVLAAYLTNWFSTMATFLAIYYVPLYLQVRGMSSTQAGLRILPFAVAASVGSLGTGAIMRASGKYYVLLVATMAVLIAGSALLCTFTQDSPSWATYVYMSPLGIGYGGMLTITLVAMIGAVEHQEQAVITAASYAFRGTGSTIGITVAGAIFQNILTRELQQKYGSRPGSAAVIEKIKNSLDGMNHLPEGWKRNVVLGFYMDAFRAAFVAGLGLAGLATVSGMFMREHFLHSKLDRK